MMLDMCQRGLNQRDDSFIGQRNEVSLGSLEIGLVMIQCGCVVVRGECMNRGACGRALARARVRVYSILLFNLLNNIIIKYY